MANLMDEITKKRALTHTHNSGYLASWAMMQTVWFARYVLWKLYKFEAKMKIAK